MLLYFVEKFNICIDWRLVRTVLDFSSAKTDLFRCLVLRTKVQNCTSWRSTLFCYYWMAPSCSADRLYLMRRRYIVDLNIPIYSILPLSEEPDIFSHNMFYAMHWWWQPLFPNYQNYIQVPATTVLPNYVVKLKQQPLRDLCNRRPIVRSLSWAFDYFSNKFIP